MDVVFLAGIEAFVLDLPGEVGDAERFGDALPELCIGIARGGLDFEEFVAHGGSLVQRWGIFDSRRKWFLADFRRKKRRFPQRMVHADFRRGNFRWKRAWMKRIKK